MEGLLLVLLAFQDRPVPKPDLARGGVRMMRAVAVTMIHHAPITRQEKADRLKLLFPRGTLADEVIAALGPPNEVYSRGLPPREYDCWSYWETGFSLIIGPGEKVWTPDER